MPSLTTLSQRRRRQPNAQAVNAWDGDLSYGELDSLSTQLAQHLIGLGIGPEVVVSLFFEKSVWTPVSVLAVMKARGASVILDVTQPEDRLRMMVEKVSPSVILSSTSTMYLAVSLYAGTAVIAVDRDFLESLQPLQSGYSLEHPLPSDPANLLYLVFASGSTGTPKADAINHANMCSTFTNQLQVIALSTTSRVLDWGSYAFDLSWYTVLQTFYSSAVLCIPRQGYDVSKAIKSLKPNFITCTPTGASILNDEALKSRPHKPWWLVGSWALRMTYPFFSSLSGQQLGNLDKQGQLGPRYWQQNLESPVRFKSAMVELLKHPSIGKTVFLEVGPHAALDGPIRQILTNESREAPQVSTLTRR